MVARTYYGIGPAETAVARFNDLRPYVVEILSLRSECEPMGSDFMAMSIALDGLDTAAFHFTRRRDFYHQVEAPPYQAGNGRLRDREAAKEAFSTLMPYANALRHMQFGCRPFGRDYMALDVAKQSLDTTVYHFTGDARFFASKSDSSGPLRP